MLEAFKIVLPLFALVALGYGIARTRFWTDAATGTLSKFVFYFALPALLFRTMSRQTFPEEFDLDIIVSYFGGAAIVFAIAMVLGRAVFRLGVSEMAILGMGGTYGNSVLLGIPLVFLTYGDAGILPLSLIIVFNALIIIPSATYFLELGRSGGTGLARLFWGPLKGLIRNPIIMAVLFGTLYGQVAGPLPGPVDQFLKTLGNAAPAVALFALGASLAVYEVRSEMGRTSTMILLKIAVHPLLVWLLAFHVFTMDPVWAAVAVINAAMPVGANVFLLARQYGVAVGPAASAVIISTALCAVTVSILIGFLTR